MTSTSPSVSAVIADILRRHGKVYLDADDAAAPVPQRLAVRRVTACRTGRLGGHGSVTLGGPCKTLIGAAPHHAFDALLCVR